MISVYSFCSAVFLFNFLFIFIFLLRKNRDFMLRSGTSSVFALALLSLIRLFTPVDLERAVIIPSETIIPAIRDVLRYRIFGTLSIGEIVMLVWALGIVYKLYREVRAYAVDCWEKRYIERIFDPRIEAMARSFGLKESNVVVSPEIGMPMVYGFFRPKIFLPAVEMSDGELNWIFRHELQHFRSRDAWIKLAYLLVSAFLWWNPLMSRFQREIDKLLELRCDLKVTGDLSNDERVEYLQTILSAIKRAKAASITNEAPVSTLSKPQNDTMQRFQIVLGYEKNKYILTRITSVLCVFALFFASYFVIWQPRGYPPPEELEGVFTLERENAYIKITEDGRYLIYMNDEFLWEATARDMENGVYEDLEIIDRR